MMKTQDEDNEIAALKKKIISLENKLKDRDNLINAFLYLAEMSNHEGFQRRKFQTRSRFFSLPPLPTTHYVILHHYNDIHK